MLGGEVNANIHGLNTHTLALSEPHEHGQMPKVVGQHVAAVEFVVAALEG
jgi:hypothetical protein